MPYDTETLATRFAVDGRLARAEPTSGHINDSFIVTYQHGDRATRYLLQRINEFVFPHPAEVMENIQRVTAHIAARLKTQGVADVHRRVLTLVPTHEGEPYHCDAAGGCWRLYHFIKGTRVYEAVETPRQAEFVGQAFGTFQCLLANFAGPRLHETIPDFHNTPLRYEVLDHAVQADPCNRAAIARAAIDLAKRYRPLAGILLDLHKSGRIPERIAHNDAKISNVLLDETTGEALCVVDLDTVMPGLALYDFGDMVRSMTTTAAEDETDQSKVEVEMPLFEGLARGYLGAAGEFLTSTERNSLVVAGKLITLEQAVRFLTDFLVGDKYYKTHRPRHNLDRCRAQFKLVESIERHEALMNRFVESL
ncbi:MAG: aminoglycoside phosphotransferase family protein [Planctomycetes bacterium]|nr:aminoglycoside phosphotransferase family protein [Planctomycetota bacterium]